MTGGEEALSGRGCPGPGLAVPSDSRGRVRGTPSEAQSRRDPGAPAPSVPSPWAHTAFSQERSGQAAHPLLLPVLSQGGLGWPPARVRPCPGHGGPALALQALRPLVSFSNDSFHRMSPLERCLGDSHLIEEECEVWKRDCPELVSAKARPQAQFLSSKFMGLFTRASFLRVRVSAHPQSHTHQTQTSAYTQRHKHNELCLQVCKLGWELVRGTPCAWGLAVPAQRHWA